MNTTPHVVIVGAGFAGLYAARILGRAAVRVTVVDRKNHHTFQPLLYQVATAGLSPGEIAAPIRSILSDNRNTDVLLAEAAGVDLAGKRLHTRHGEVPFDYLIVAGGATHAYFGHDEWEPLAPGLKTVEDATEIRRRILLAFEMAERKARLNDTQEPINMVVIGAGPTGVELAGALAEITRRVLAEDFRSIDPRRARIILIEAGPRALATYSEDLSRSAEEQLRHLGVEVMTGHPVTEVTETYVAVNGQRLSAAVTLWCAGVASSPLGKTLGVPLDRAGRVVVEPDLSIPGFRNVFVVGDMASVKKADGTPVPGVAPAAIQMGEFAARMILADIGGAPRQTFRYRDKGSLATIGRNAAIAQIGRVHLSGFTAWLAWLFVHVYFLIGFRNRLFVIWEWAWSYLTFQRGARLITGQSNWIVPPKAPGSVQREINTEPASTAHVQIDSTR